MTSAAQFVEGGVQDACDDACSICLENYSDEDPATVTSCKHEYHLQCILEWSQRSKECPMCWQPLSLKDSDSQELLAAVEQERALRRNRAQQALLRSPLEEYEFHRFSSYGDDSDFEERIMQHLAAAAMGRAHQLARRDPIRFRSSGGQGHQHFVIVPSHTSSAPAPSSSIPAATDAPAAAHGPLIIGHHDPPVHSLPVGGQPGSTAVRPVMTSNHAARAGSSSGDASSFRASSFGESAEENHHGTSSSESPSFSETFKSRLAAASSRYRESFSKTTRGFRERLRARNDKHKDGGEARPGGSTESHIGNSSRQSAFVQEVQGHGSLGGSASSTATTVFAGSVIAGSSRVAPQPIHDEANGSFSGSRRKGTDGNTSSGQDDQQQSTVVLPLV